MSKGRKLSSAEKKQIEAAIARANRTDKKEKSAQDSIPYQRMWPDGICRVTDTHYVKTIRFQDTNYQLSQNEDKTAIFDGWCEFLNFFDASIQFQLTFVNLSTSEENIAQRINIPLNGDGFDNIRAEYTQMLRDQVAKGKNGLTKTKYLTFGIDSDSFRVAKSRLERIEIDLINNIQSVDQAKAIKTIKRKITDLDKAKIDEQKKVVRAGYDMEIIPSDLATYGAEAKKLLQDLQSRNERMFLVTFLIMNTANSQKAV